MKFNNLGFSVYVSHFKEQITFLEKLENQDRLLFTSLHIPEEMGHNYLVDIKYMLSWLADKNFKLICDISRRTLEIFSVKTIEELAEKLNIYMLRIDYGFDLEELLQASKKFPLVFNASTINISDAILMNHMYGLHNFYPREYTGLSFKQFHSINKELNHHNIDVLSFIPNCKYPRGPLFEGLPTIECQRFENPYVNFIALSITPNVQGIILGDLNLDEVDLEYIRLYETDKIISIPARMDNQLLYNKIFTIRIDSPETSLRIQETRGYSAQKSSIYPCNTFERTRGSITCDNLHFLRYSGEVQIIKSNLPQDDRINIIGKISNDYMNLCSIIPNGSKIIFRNNS